MKISKTEHENFIKFISITFRYSIWDEKKVNLSVYVAKLNLCFVISPEAKLAQVSFIKQVIPMHLLREMFK